jgi:osmotically-inducible protein OsmY
VRARHTARWRATQGAHHLLDACGTRAAVTWFMPGRNRETPRTYDEIVRKTVPDPDSSQRPTARQEQLAYEGFRAMDDAESALHHRVIAELASIGEPGIDVEIDRETATLRGRVRNAATIALVEETVRGVDGVERIVNRLVVGT